jgi:hypothetical protein
MIPAPPKQLSFLAFCLCLLLTELCLAQNIVKNSDFADGSKGWYTYNKNGPKPDVVDVKDLKNSTKAIKIEVKEADPKKSYLASLTQGIVGYVPKGTELKLSFKAKGSADKIIQALVQLNGKPYTAIVDSGKIALTGKWETYTFTGTAKTDFEPGGVRLYFPMGDNDGMVYLTDITMDMPETGLPPAGQPLNTNHDFARDRSGWGIPGDQNKCEYSFADLATHRIMKIDIKQGNPKKPWDVSITQGIACKMPKDTHVKLLVRARSQTPDAVMNIYVEGKGGHKERLIKLDNQKLSEDWQWYTGEAVMPKDYNPYEVRTVLQLAFKQQVIEFDQIELVHMAK